MISVIIGAAGTITKSFRKCPSYLPGKHETKEIQKTAISGTAHTLRNVLMQKYSTFNVGNSVLCTMKSNYRIAAILHSLETSFVSGI